MTPGKLAAQAGHAYTNTLLASLSKNPTSTLEYETPGNIGTKICLQANSLEHLLYLHERAEAQAIPCQLITDSGHIMPPNFTGEPIVTALGIGPIDAKAAKPLLGNLRLVK